MADEEKPDLEQEAATDKEVATADLETALAESLEKEKPSKVGKIEEEELTDHAERSRLGRRVKRMEDYLDQVLSKLDSFTYQHERSRDRTEIASEEIPEVISTSADVNKVLDARERKIHQEQMEYEKKYLGKVTSFASENQEMHEDILGLMDKEWKVFGLRHSNLPEYDAELNYLKAKAALLSRKMAQPKPKPNVRGEKPPISTDLSMSSPQELSSSSHEIHLDDFAADYVKRIGMKDESVKEALKGETPFHLVKNK